MGFWREAAKPWIGPSDPEVWEGLNVGEITDALNGDKLSYRMLRTWPVYFRDKESLKAFISKMQEFANPAASQEESLDNPANPVFRSGDQNYDNVEAFFQSPKKSRTAVTISIWNNRGNRFSMTMSSRAKQTAFDAFDVPSHVLVTAEEPLRHAASDVRVRDVMASFIEHTHPMTRRQKWDGKHSEVVSTMTEAEYYADSRARKTKIQSFLLGIVGGVASAALIFWLGLYPH